MITETRNSAYSLLLKLLKLLVFFLSAWLIYKELFVKEKFENFLLLVKNKPDWFSLNWFLLGASLVVVNWGIETRKWQILVKSFEHISYFKAFGAVLTGVFVSFFTPNRVGEFAGRIIYLDYSKKWEAALSTIVGSFSQLLCTLVFGLLGFFFFIGYESAFATPVFTWVFVFLWLLVVISAISLFVNIDRLYVLLKWLKLPRKWIKHFVILRKMEKPLLLRILWLSTLRYLVFTLQYFFFLKAFQFSIPFHLSLMCIGTLFLLQSLVPTFALSELTLRGASAQQIFGVYEDKPAEIMMAAYSIWLINIFIPALAGSVVFLFKKMKNADS